VTFWVVMPCGLVGGYRGLVGQFCLHLQCGSAYTESGGDVSLANVGSHIRDKSVITRETTLQKLLIVQLVKEFSTIYWNRRLINMFVRALHGDS
jgi:hypothetical protein